MTAGSPTSRRLLPHVSVELSLFWVTAALMALVILSSLIDFSVFFTRFHQLFFTEGSWIFYEDEERRVVKRLPSRVKYHMIFGFGGSGGKCTTGKFLNMIERMFLQILILVD